MEQKMDTQELMQLVDEDPPNKIKTQLQKLDEEWRRTDFESKLETVDTILDSIEQLVTDIQTQIKQKRQEIQAAQKDFGESDTTRELATFHQKHNQKFTYKPVLDRTRELEKLRRREAQWRTVQQAVVRIALKNLGHLATGMYKEIIGGEQAKSMHKANKEMIETEVQHKFRELDRKIDGRTRTIERAVDILLNRMETYEDALTEYGGRSLDVIEQQQAELSQLRGIVREVADKPLSEVEGLPTDEHGRPDLFQQADPEDEQPGNDALEQVSASDNGPDQVSASDDGDKQRGPEEPDNGDLIEESTEAEDGTDDDEMSDAEYPLKFKSLQDQYLTLRKMAENEDVKNMSQREITALTDYNSKTALFGDDKTLDKVKQQFGDPFDTDDE